jgi:hypothetical protein
MKRREIKMDIGGVSRDILSPVLCVYNCHIFPFYYLNIFFLTHLDRKHYYIKVVESIQFVCTWNSGIFRVLCNANTYPFINISTNQIDSYILVIGEANARQLGPRTTRTVYCMVRVVLTYGSSSLGLPWDSPYIHFYFSSLHLQYKRPSPLRLFGP